MLIESVFLTAHKWIDWAFVTGSFGWKWRPHYQVPKVFNYSYGNQGLHVENVYDPFQDTAYDTGPLYRRMMDLVELVGQGPNPTWVKQRRQMATALELTNRRLSYRARPEWQSRSLKAQGYWLKQFSLSLHLQFLRKYFPETMVRFFEYKVFPPLVNKIPQLAQRFERQVRKVDYYLANKSLGYHLILDIFEQLNPPLDDDDKIIPYDYISIPGKRIMAGYKDFVYLTEMLSDLEREVKEYGEKYSQYVKIAQQEKFKAMAAGDPMALRFVMPNFDEYCSKFLNYDVKQKTEALIDLKRCINDYRIHISIPDNVVRFIHKLWFSKNSPFYNNYWKDRYEAKTLEEAIQKLKEQRDQDDLIRSGQFSDVKLQDDNIKNKLKSVNQYYTDFSASKAQRDVNMYDKLSAMKRDIDNRYKESVTRLSRENVQVLRQMVGTDPFIEHAGHKRQQTPYTAKAGEKDPSPRLYYPTETQFDAEIAAVQSSIVEEIYDILPSTITDKNFLEPVIQDYYNDRINQYMYIHYPHLLEAEVKEKLDLSYDKDSLQVYSEFVSDRVKRRQEERIKKQEILAPYKIIEQAFHYKDLYKINREDHMVLEYLMQGGEDAREPSSSADIMWGGSYIDPSKLSPGESLPHARYKARQRHQYAQMLHDMDEMTKLELEKAKKLTLGLPRQQTVSWLEKSANWSPMKRIREGLPPFVSTAPQNDRWDVAHVTKDDMRYVAKAFPGVGFDQFLNVMDQQDTYSPVKKDNLRRETFEWIGMPRTHDGGYRWKNEHNRELKFKEQAKDLALRQLYAKRIHASEHDPRQMRHDYIMNRETDRIYEAPEM